MRITDITESLPAVMGILNVTPDSFSDGGKYLDPESAVKKAEEMISQGADIIDIGGESTRPGAEKIHFEEEIKRIIPVIKEIRKKFDIRISCDTSKYEVAERAIAAGADMINDVAGFKCPQMRKVAAENNAAICIMHMKGTVRTMQENPVYENVLEEIRDFLYGQAALCEDDGIDRSNIIIDPGIGFGKQLEHNLKILSNIKYFAEKYPVMIGASRKSFLNNILGIPVEERLAGSLAVASYSTLNSAAVLRVHDVKETRETIKVIKALEG